MNFEELIVTILTPVAPVYTLFTDEMPTGDFIVCDTEERPVNTKQVNTLKEFNTTVLLVNKDIASKNTLKTEIFEALTTAAEPTIKNVSLVNTSTSFDETLRRYLTRLNFLIYAKI